MLFGNMFPRLYHPLILRGACKESCKCTCRCITGEALTFSNPLHIELSHRLRSKDIMSAGQEPEPGPSGSGSSSTSSTKRNSLSQGQHDRLRCLFCRIVDGNESSSKNEILFQDEEFVVFPDIRPASIYHLLVVTKEHIKDAKSLTASQAPLIDRMVDTGKKVLSERIASEKKTSSDNPENIIANTLFGFHWPPFHTISHLHLHVIAPSNQIGFIGRIIFRPNSYWFVQPTWVKERLTKSKPEILDKPDSA